MFANNIIPLEIEYKLRFLTANLVFAELFFLCKPEKVKIDLGPLLATDAIYYAYYVPNGICYTNESTLQTYIT